MGGVVNLITKSPWELEGGRFRIGGGELGTLYAGGSWARGGESWASKVSASYYEQDPYDRPTGLVPGTGTPYPSFPNQGTEQPEIDLRLDKDLTLGDQLTLSAGWAETDGVVHSGIGPFDIDGGSSLGFLQSSWTRGGFEARAWANLLDGSATNLLSVGTDGLPLTFGFQTDSYHVEARDQRPIGPVDLVVGGSARRTEYDILIAPTGDQRDEVGVFAQADIELTSRLRWIVGARWDDIDPIGSVVSPRTGLALSPNPHHTFRLSSTGPFVLLRSSRRTSTPRSSPPSTSATSWELRSCTAFPPRRSGIRISRRRS